MTIDSDDRLPREIRLADGTCIRLRLLRPGDRETLRRGFEQLSPTSRYRRFFTAMPRLPEGLLRALTETDGVDHVAIGAVRLAAAREQDGIGVARFVRLAERPQVAEAAVAVVDAHHRQGIGRALLASLASEARARGIARFRAHVLTDNEPTRALLASVSEHPEIRFDGDALVYEVEIPPAPVAAADTGVYRLLKLAAGEVELVFRAVRGRARREPDTPGRMR